MRGAQISWAILAGEKVIENRSWRIAPGWYALHTGTGVASSEQKVRMRARVPTIPAESSLPKGVIVGALQISHSLNLERCTSSPWASGPICNVVAQTCALKTPVAHKGALSLWPISADLLPEVQLALASAPIRCNREAIAAQGIPSAAATAARPAPISKKRLRAPTSGVPASREPSRSRMDAEHVSAPSWARTSGESAFANCPICSCSVPLYRINEHLDECVAGPLADHVTGSDEAAPGIGASSAAICSPSEHTTRAWTQ